MTDRLNRTSNFAASQEHKQTFLCGVCELDGFSENYPTAEARQAHYDATGHKAVQAYLDELHTVKRAVREAFPNATEVSESEVRSLAPEYRAPGSKLRGRQYGNNAPKSSAPTEKQTNYVKKLIAERNGEDPSVKAIRMELNAASRENRLTSKLVSSAIDRLKKIQPSVNSTIRQTPTPSNSAPEAAQSPSEPRNRAIRITNRYPGKCGSCGQSVDAGEGIWQLDDEGNRGVFHLDGQCPLSDLGIPTGRYAVEHEGTLKFYNLKRNGLFVMASDEEHQIKKNETIQAIADLIKIDPLAAMRRYGHEIGKCGRCGRTLTDEISRQNGIGPICESKAWG